MNEHTVHAVVLICFFLLIILTLGEPDLIDAMVVRLMR